MQEVVIKTISKKKKWKKAKCLSEEALQIAEKRREAKGKGEKERHTHLNAEFQRLARRDKKDLKWSTQDHEWEKTRDLFKKIRDTKGIFHEEMGTIKETNGMDLQKQKILRRVGKNTQKNCTKKIFMTQITTVVSSFT